MGHKDTRIKSCGIEEGSKEKFVLHSSVDSCWQLGVILTVHHFIAPVGHLSSLWANLSFHGFSLLLFLLGFAGWLEQCLRLGLGHLTGSWSLCTMKLLWHTRISLHYLSSLILTIAVPLSSHTNSSWISQQESSQHTHKHVSSKEGCRIKKAKVNIHPTGAEHRHSWTLRGCATLRLLVKLCEDSCSKNMSGSHF